MPNLPNLIDGNRVALPIDSDTAENVLTEHGFVVTHDRHPDIPNLLRWATLPTGWTATQDTKLRISDADGRPMFHVRPANDICPAPTLWVKNHYSQPFEELYEERAVDGWVTYVPRAEAA